jgi:hypothetical protein
MPVYADNLTITGLRADKEIIGWKYRCSGPTGATWVEVKTFDEVIQANYGPEFDDDYREEQPTELNPYCDGVATPIYKED